MNRLTYLAVGCLVLVASACSGTTGPEQESDALCEQARSHVESCTGEAPAPDEGSCDRETASEILDQSCDEIEESSSNKRDGVISSTLCKLSIEHCKFRSIHSGHGFSCGLKSDGDIKCWTRDDGDRKELATPEGIKFKRLSAGKEHICGVQIDSEGWYEDSPYCLKFGDFSEQESAPRDDYVFIAAGAQHNCGLMKDDETIECWGRDDLRGEEPLEAPSGTFEDVAAGRAQSCGIRPDGSVECWGADSGFAEAVPDVAFESIEISNTRQYACGIVAAEDGGVECWGTTDSPWPGEPSSGDFYRISVGGGFACGITRDAGMTCWGEQITGMTEAPDGEYAGIAAGKQHFCALDRDDSTPTCQWPSLDL